MEVMMETGYIMVITTCVDRESARAISKLLVERRLAACVQMMPVESVYTWQGSICEDNETALIIKSKAALFEEISLTIKEKHSYEIPEIVQIPITDGLPEYLNWIDECTGTTYGSKRNLV